jgi:hypothetical protein
MAYIGVADERLLLRREGARDIDARGVARVDVPRAIRDVDGAPVLDRVLGVRAIEDPCLSLGRFPQVEGRLAIGA